MLQGYSVAYQFQENVIVRQPEFLRPLTVAAPRVWTLLDSRESIQAKIEVYILPGTREFSCKT